METAKDKMIKLWKQTCQTTNKRLRGSMVGCHYYLPSDVKKFVREYFDYDIWVAEYFDADVNDVSSYGKKVYLYFIYDEIPPLILEKVEYRISGKIKTEQVKRLVKKRWPFIGYKEIEETVLIAEEVDRVKEKYPGVEIDMTSRNFGHFSTEYQVGAALTFGNHRCVISPELTKELIKMYFDAGRRVDLDIMDKRIEETNAV